MFTLDLFTSVAIISICAVVTLGVLYFSLVLRYLTISLPSVDPPLPCFRLDLCFPVAPTLLLPTSHG